MFVRNAVIKSVNNSAALYDSWLNCVFHLTVVPMSYFMVVISLAGESKENDDPERTFGQTWQAEWQHSCRVEQGLCRLQVFNFSHVSAFL